MVQYLQNYKCYDVNQGHFRKSLQSSGNTTKIYLLKLPIELPRVVQLLTNHCLVFPKSPFQVQFYLSFFFLLDLFYIYNDLDYASYADDTTPYVCRQNYAEAIEFLELTINNVFAWFKDNGLVANSGKSHFQVSLYVKISLKILGSTIESSFL